VLAAAKLCSFDVIIKQFCGATRAIVLALVNRPRFNLTPSWQKCIHFFKKKPPRPLARRASIQTREGGVEPASHSSRCVPGGPIPTKKQQAQTLRGNGLLSWRRRAPRIGAGRRL